MKDLKNSNFENIINFTKKADETVKKFYDTFKTEDSEYLKELLREKEPESFKTPWQEKLEVQEKQLDKITQLVEINNKQLAELQLQTENNKKAADSSTFWAKVAIGIALISLIISLKDLILPLLEKSS